MIQPKALRMLKNTLAQFQATTDLHSDQPHWFTLSLLAEHLVISTPLQFIPLPSITRIWVSSDMAEQITCVAYRDQEGRTRTLALRLRDGQGRPAGAQFKALVRRVA